VGESVKTIGVRARAHLGRSGHGRTEGQVVHAEHLGADTNLYLDCEKAGLITRAHLRSTMPSRARLLYATPQPDRIYRFDADGRAVR